MPIPKGISKAQPKIGIHIQHPKAIKHDTNIISPAAIIYVPGLFADVSILPHSGHSTLPTYMFLSLAVLIFLNPFLFFRSF
ncbi:hypothetical protein ANS014_25240 [Paraclostridium bifermentans]|nr:hypothetical protein ANS014_25240 [Paraclostridium bifermentans]